MLKIGIIGMSAGNAHPYSWSAIINGVFDVGEVVQAGYPAVAEYLKANEDTLGIPGAKVTHVWCQEKAISHSIAKNSRIPDVVNSMEGMIGEVDAVILARDDPENHVAMAHPFLEAGVPLFIDKPLAYTWEDLEYFKEQQQLGRFVMSCSSMRYAHECRTVKTNLKTLGQLHLVLYQVKRRGVQDLARLLAAKDESHYGVTLVNRAKARRLVGYARRMAEHAREVLEA
jgi:predicted dehydrogenase